MSDEQENGAFSIKSNISHMSKINTLAQFNICRHVCKCYSSHLYLGLCEFHKSNKKWPMTKFELCNCEFDIQTIQCTETMLCRIRVCTVIKYNSFLTGKINRMLRKCINFSVCVLSTVSTLCLEREVNQQHKYEVMTSHRLRKVARMKKLQSFAIISCPRYDEIDDNCVTLTTNLLRIRYANMNTKKKHTCTHIP